MTGRLIGYPPANSNRVRISPDLPSTADAPSYCAPRVETGPYPVSEYGTPILTNERYDFIRPDSGLSEGQGKYCRCLLRVQAKGGAYSPYGVCINSTGHQVRSCSAHYDWGVMSLEMLLAYADLHRVEVPNRGSRQSALDAIASWKSSKGESF